MPLRTALLTLAVVTATACGATDPDDPGDLVDPVEVAPAEEDARPDAQTPGVSGPPGLWVEDAIGQGAGILIRRGSDDQVGGRAHYDQVTVFHPESGLFYELTMADGVVRYPVTTFFAGFGCDTPVGVAAGGCDTCLAGYGTALLHGERWWRVRGGEAARQLTAGSTRGTGRATDCVAHSTSSARGFPVDEVAGARPPTAFTPPLRFVWR